MSTRNSIAGVEVAEDVGGVTYHASLHLYKECFDESPQPVHVDMFQRGVFSNSRASMELPQDKALELADQLTAWAASVREHEGLE